MQFVPDDVTIPIAYQWSSPDIDLSVAGVTASTTRQILVISPTNTAGQSVFPDGATLNFICSTTNTLNTSLTASATVQVSICCLISDILLALLW